MQTTHEVLYLHGLESGPQGHKATWLREHYGAFAVDLDTGHAQASCRQALEQGRLWDHRWPDIIEDFKVPLERAKAAIRPETRLIVGSSFGGAVLTHLLHQEVWSGPSLLIASAGLKLSGHSSLPAGMPVILLHGRDDDVIPLDDARSVAAQSADNVLLWEIKDGHRMKTIIPKGLLNLAMSWLLTESSLP